MNAIAFTTARQHPRRLWPWLLGALLLLCLLAAASGLAWLVNLPHDWHDGAHIMLDADDWPGEGSGTLLALVAGLLAGGAALVVGLLAVLVVVPLALALALLGVALGIAAAVSAVLAVAAALLLPLWLPLLLLWLLLRRRPGTTVESDAPRR